MRIIAGSLKGRRLAGPDPGDTRIRPTADRAREALFSILQRWPSGAFVDLFAGTGAVALEAWSRGYDPVACVESSPVALKLQAENLRGTSVRVVREDAMRLGAQAFRDLAVLFADPPYDAAAAAWEKVAAIAMDWLAPGGVVVWETDARTTLPGCPGWEEIEARRYGAACFHFLIRTDDRIDTCSDCPS